MECDRSILNVAQQIRFVADFVAGGFAPAGELSKFDQSR